MQKKKPTKKFKIENQIKKTEKTLGLVITTRSNFARRTHIACRQTQTPPNTSDLPGGSRNLPGTSRDLSPIKVFLFSTQTRRQRQIHKKNVEVVLPALGNVAYTIKMGLRLAHWRTASQRKTGQQAERPENLDFVC